MNDKEFAEVMVDICMEHIGDGIAARVKSGESVMIDFVKQLNIIKEQTGVHDLDEDAPDLVIKVDKCINERHKEVNVNRCAMIGAGSFSVMYF